MGTLLIYSFCILVITFAFGLIPLLKNWTERYLTLFTGFGAGILLSVSLLYMIPEAFSMIGEHAGIVIIMGFLLIYVLEKFFMMHPCSHGCDLHKISVAAFVGLSVHGIIDGAALGSSVILPRLGNIVFFAMLIHKAPEAFSLSAILRLGTYTQKQRILLLSFFSLMLPLGAIIVFKLIHQFNSTALGSIIALSAGTFLHISMCDLLPQLHKEEKNKWGDLLAFLTGIFVMVVLSGFYKG